MTKTYNMALTIDMDWNIELFINNHVCMDIESHKFPKVANWSKKWNNERFIKKRCVHGEDRYAFLESQMWQIERIFVVVDESYRKAIFELWD